MDKWLEDDIKNYLGENDEILCENVSCSYHAPEEYWGYDEDLNILICPKCGAQYEL